MPLAIRGSDAPGPGGILAAPSSCPHEHQSDRVGFRFEENARLPVLELRANLRDLLLQGMLALAVIGALAQHEGLDHPPQRFGGELRVGYRDGLAQLRRVRESRRRISR